MWHRESLTVLLDVAERLRRRGFTDLQYINLGGGLGIDYEQHVRRLLHFLPHMPGSSDIVKSTKSESWWLEFESFASESESESLQKDSSPSPSP